MYTLSQYYVHIRKIHWKKHFMALWVMYVDITLMLGMISVCFFDTF